MVTRIRTDVKLIEGSDEELDASPVFGFDVLRRRFSEHPILAKVDQLILQICYIDQVDAFCPLDQLGHLYTHEEFRKLVVEMEKFYQLVSDREIEEGNNAAVSRKHNYAAPGVKRESSKSVYLMRKNNGDCKIGISLNPKDRLKQVKTVEPSIELLCFFNADDPLKAEESLHNNYMGKHVGGEWFDLTGKDIQYIESIKEYKDGRFYLSDKGEGK